jgi:hypothetical protein
MTGDSSDNASKTKTFAKLLYRINDGLAAVARLVVVIRMVAIAIVVTATSTARASIGVIRPIVVIATTD